MSDSAETTAASLEKQGKSLFRSKKYLQSAEVFSRAAEIFAAQEQASLAAEMHNNEGVAYLMAGKPRRAEAVLLGTSEIFLDAGDVLKAGMALANLATALKDQGRGQEAISNFSQSADLFRTAGADEMFLQSMQSVSSLKLKSRDLAGALFAMQSGLSSLERPSWRQKLLRSFLNIPSRLLSR